MGRAKEITYFNGRLKGKYLEDEDCMKLEKLIKLDQSQGYISDLERVIYSLSPNDVDFIIESKSTDFVDRSAKGRLEKLQTIAVAYMYFAKRLVLGDSVGLGKTVEVCGLFNLLENELWKNEHEEFRFLFLTEKKLVSETRKKLIKFTGNYVDAVYGDKKDVERFRDENVDMLNSSIVGPHSLLNSVLFQEYFREQEALFGRNPFNILVIDESGILANSTTKVSKNAKYFASMFDRVILLNATSFEKELASFYNQLSIVDDSFLPTKTNFNKEYVEYDYTGPYPRPNGKYKNAEKFRELVGYRYFARTRKGNGAVMKDCTAEVIVSELSGIQKVLLKKTSIPQMVYDCPGYFGMGVETNVETTPKLNDLLGLLLGRLKNESVLVYVRYKEAQDAIQNILLEYGIECCIMNGETSIEEKDRIVSDFIMGKTQVLITNVQKGMDFGNCNNCIFYTYDSNPSRMVQFEGRMTRSFDIVGKHVYVLISEGNELKKFNTIVRDRATASDLFTGSDFSCVLSLLLKEEVEDNDSCVNG